MAVWFDVSCTIATKLIALYKQFIHIYLAFGILLNLYLSHFLKITRLVYLIFINLSLMNVNLVTIVEFLKVR